MSEQNRGGRPPEIPGLSATETIQLKISPEEKAEIIRRAKAAGEGASTWCRAAVRQRLELEREIEAEEAAQRTAPSRRRRRVKAVEPGEE